MSTADIYDASVKTLKANAEVLADTQNALLKHIFESNLDEYRYVFESSREMVEYPTIPYGIVEIGAWAMSNFWAALEFVIPEGVTKINHFAFCNAENLQGISFPSTLEIIYSKAFSNGNGASQIAPDVAIRINLTCDAFNARFNTDSEGVSDYGFKQFRDAGIPLGTEVTCTDGTVVLEHKLHSVGSVVPASSGKDNQNILYVGGVGIFSNSKDFVKCNCDNADEGVFFIFDDPADGDEFRFVRLEYTEGEGPQTITFFKVPSTFPVSECTGRVEIRSRNGFTDGDLSVYTYDTPVRVLPD